jgi:DNA-binding MarR family transcriptional regulator
MPARRALVDQAATALRGLLRQMRWMGARRGLPGGITPSRVFVFRLLSENKTLTPSDLAHRLNVSRATVTGMLNRLEAKGLIERVRAGSDRRVVQIQATPKAQRLMQKFRDEWRSSTEKALAPLTDGQLRTLVGLLATIGPPSDPSTRTRRPPKK